MKNKIKTMALVVFLLISGSSTAQFNTLTPTLPKKEEIQKPLEIPKKEDNEQKDKTGKWWKWLRNRPTKSDLKQDIDSLKTLMKEYNSKNSFEKAYFEKLKDSLLLLTRSNPEQKKEFAEYKNSFARYGFIKEPSFSFSKIVMPLDREISVTSPYGTRIHPIFGAPKMHNGIDLKAHYENIYAVMDGIVTATGWDPKGGGNFIKVRHFDRFETAYLHLSEIYYKTGELVKAGFVIGRSGNSGNSTGPHLHFSVKEFGQNINPAHFLNDLIKANQLIATYYAK